MDSNWSSGRRKIERRDQAGNSEEESKDGVVSQEHKISET
jgi:hypothetical protein